MKKTLLTVVLLGLILMPTMGVFAQTSASDNATATVVVNDPISIAPTNTGTDEINFGAVETGASVSLPADPGAATAGVTGANVALAEFTVSGTPGANFTVTFGDPVISNGTTDVTVTALAWGDVDSDPTGGAAVSTGGSVATDGTTGDFYLWVGGSFTAPATADTYTTSGGGGATPMTITVEYL